MQKWLAAAVFLCGMATNGWARLNATAHDEIAGWKYTVLKDDVTGEKTLDANLADLGGRGFMSLGCAPVAAGKPTVFLIISPREVVGVDGEPGRIVYRVGERPAVQSGGTFRKAVWRGQPATYILPEGANELPRMLRRMTQGPSMEVEVAPSIPALAVNLRFRIGNVKTLYNRIEKDCPGFTKTF